MTSLPMATSSSWQRHDAIIYLARNDGAKMLSHPGGANVEASFRTDWTEALPAFCSRALPILLKF